MKGDAAAANGVFATTRWSLVACAAHPSENGEPGRQALAELCRVYWRPIFLYILSRGYPVPEAQDLTQDFFVMILEGDLLGRANENRGRFLSFLLCSLRYFLDHARERNRAAKRGGSPSCFKQRTRPRPIST